MGKKKKCIMCGTTDFNSRSNTMCPKCRSKYYVTLSFKDYPELIERIREEAQKEVRTVQQQVIYYLMKGMGYES